MKKPKKQKKPSYRELRVRNARQVGMINEEQQERQRLNNLLREESDKNNNLKARVETLKGEIEYLRKVRENKMKQLGLYFAALDSLPSDHERLIQLQNELFDRPNYNPQDVAFTKPKNSDLF